MEKLFLLIGCAIAANFAMAQPFTVPALPYAYDALEPSIDNETMILHHDKHHAAYVKNLNDEATKDVRLKNLSLEIICKNVSMYSMAVRNNAGGHYNHSLFWTILSPQGGAPTGKLMEDIYTKYGSLDNFKSQFSDSAKTRFGSGWAWLIVLPNGEIKITTTPNQDNPLMDVAKEKGTPILALDVWEHAYYLKYRNVRPDYIKAFWEVVNWEQVSNLYKEALDNIADQQAVNKNKKNAEVKKK